MSLEHGLKESHSHPQGMTRDQQADLSFDALLSYYWTSDEQGVMIYIIQLLTTSSVSRACI